MNGIIRKSVQTLSARSLLASSFTKRAINGQITRSLWNTCNRQIDNSAALTTIKLNSSSFGGYEARRSTHSKAEKELIEFLADEIVTEKKAQKPKTIPTEVDGFKVSLDGAEVTLTKIDKDSQITVAFNVNHTVDTDAEPDLEEHSDKPDIGEMKSKPTFSVDITKGNKTLGFTCSFNNEPGASGADDSYNDIFGIDEITLYEGEHSEKVYAVAGEIVDGYLYDLLMNYLEEKGISNEFAEKLIDLSTNYEHTAYISLLEGLSKFTAGK